MHFDILTIFPEMFVGPLGESIIKRAIQARLISVALHNIRSYASDKHHTTDDMPYGGGAGMVMKVEPLAAAIRAALAGASGCAPALGRDAVAPLPQRPLEAPPVPPSGTLVALMTPAGTPFTQRVAEMLVGYERLVLVCGRYEGVDERVRETLIDRELSIGDYVLTGGELAAMVVLDTVARLVPGVLDAASIAEESHSDGLLEYPQYTRPALWEDRAVPPVLLSGHHGQVALWRRQERLRRTLERRPDLLAHAELTTADRVFLGSIGWQDTHP